MKSSARLSVPAAYMNKADHGLGMEIYWIRSSPDDPDDCVSVGAGLCSDGLQSTSHCCYAHDWVYFKEPARLCYCLDDATLEEEWERRSASKLQK